MCVYLGTRNWLFFRSEHISQSRDSSGKIIKSCNRYMFNWGEEWNNFIVREVFCWVVGRKSTLHLRKMDNFIALWRRGRILLFKCEKVNFWRLQKVTNSYCIRNIFIRQSSLRVGTACRRSEEAPVFSFKMLYMFCSRDLSLRIRISQCYVFSMLY